MTVEEEVALKAETETEAMVALSVQGQAFLLKKKQLLAQDWMIARMLTTDIPVTRVSGQIYVNVDPASFRLLLALLQGMTTLQAVVDKVSSAERLLLGTTADYLGCTDIAQALRAIEGEVEAERRAAKLSAEEENRANWEETTRVIYDAKTEVEVALSQLQVERTKAAAYKADLDKIEANILHMGTCNEIGRASCRERV